MGTEPSNGNGAATAIEGRLGALEQRLSHLEDLVEINQLFIDYGIALDAGDFETYGSLFAPDGQAMLGPMGRAQGPAAITEMMQRVLGDSVGSTYHVISSPVVEIDGDTATARVMWTVVNRGPAGEAALKGIGHHRDELVKVDGRWKFYKRKGFVDIPSAIRPDN
jgi:uncharacterized protein (TIGR02246 family)